MRNRLLLVFSFLLITSLHVLAQTTGTISGVVKSAKGATLAGATIKVEGRANNAIADNNGKFTMTLPAGTYTLIVSFVGTNTEKVKVTVIAGTTTTAEATLTDASDLSEIVVVGSRNKSPRSVTTTPVPVDIVTTKEIRNFAQADITQMLTYAAPSFQSARQTISDGTDHIDPAGLRGLGPDQTLVLLNGKRRHNTALVNINGTVGRGSVGTDMNAVPAAAIERIEILRDGAAAQYGSDAIAGVINIVLKKKYKGLNIGVMGGQNMTNMPNGNLPKMSITDGINRQVDIVGGIANEKYYVTGSFQYLSRTQSNRSGFDNIPLVYLGNGGAFPGPPTGVAPDVWRRWLIDQDKTQVTNNNYNLQNLVAGNSASDNIGAFVNAGYKLGGKTEIYISSGGSTRDGLASGFSRNPNSWNQQPVLANGNRFYANGFLPQITTIINDISVLAGIKTEFKGWSIDLSNTYGENSVEFIIKNSGNASLAATNNVQTEFKAGKIKFSQNTINADASKKYDLGNDNNVNLAFGFEHRKETYAIRSGEFNSYHSGGRSFTVPSITYTPTGQVVNPTPNPALTAAGSQVFPGFQPGDAVNAARNITAAYVDLEYTRKKVTFGAAARYENYQEQNSSYAGTGMKLAVKYDVTDNFSFRTSLNTGFRAPSLQQRYFQNQSTQFVAGVPTTVLTANNNNTFVKNAFGIQDLTPEYSFGYTFGVIGKLSKTTTLTVDAYNIEIYNRIVLSSQFQRSSSNARVAVEMNAAGVPAGVSSVQFWTNFVNTRTTGLDVVLTQKYKSGSLDGNISVAANFNKNVVDGTNSNSVIDNPLNNPSKANPNANPSQDFQTLTFDRLQRSRIEVAQPQDKIVFTATANYKKFSGMIRAVRFGKTQTFNQNDPNARNAAGVYFFDAALESDQIFSAKIISDLVLTYRFYKTCSISIGANNLFDIYPDQIFVDPRNNPATVRANPVANNLSSVPGAKTVGGYDAARDLSNRGRFLFNANQFGFNGRFVYARLNIELGDLLGK